MFKCLHQDCMPPQSRRQVSFSARLGPASLHQKTKTHKPEGPAVRLPYNTQYMYSTVYSRWRSWNKVLAVYTYPCARVLAGAQKPGAGARHKDALCIGIRGQSHSSGSEARGAELVQEKGQARARKNLMQHWSWWGERRRSEEFGGLG